MKSKALLLAAFGFFLGSTASAELTQPASCFSRAIQVVEETQDAKVLAIADRMADPSYEGFDVFFQKNNPENETGVSRVIFWRSSCTIASLRTAKTLDDLDSGDLNEDGFGR